MPTARVTAGPMRLLSSKASLLKWIRYSEASERKR